MSAPQVWNYPENYFWFKATSTFTNKTNFFAVVVGANIVPTPGTIGANSSPSSIQVLDPDTSTILDQQALQADNYISAPTTAGNIFWVGLTRRMLVPPFGQVVIAGGSSSMSIVLCKTLSDAVKIL